MTGLAYAQDESARTWTLTRHAGGRGLDDLRPGQRLKLTLSQHEAAEYVSDFSPLD